MVVSNSTEDFTVFYTHVSSKNNHPKPPANRLGDLLLRNFPLNGGIGGLRNEGEAE
jgi:hypothetical protein